MWVYKINKRSQVNNILLDKYHRTFNKRKKKKKMTIVQCLLQVVNTVSRVSNEVLFFYSIRTGYIMRTRGFNQRGDKIITRFTNIFKMQPLDSNLYSFSLPMS